MTYVDGFAAAVLIDNREKYLEHARKAAKVFKDHGAINVIECWGEDVPDGEITSFPKAVACKENESVVFSWITWPSKAVRTEGWKKAMEDPRMSSESNPMPFDGKRLIYGGFEVILES